MNFLDKKKWAFVSTDTAGANQLIGVVAFIYFKTKKTA